MRKTDTGIEFNTAYNYFGWEESTRIVYQEHRGYKTFLGIARTFSDMCRLIKKYESGV